VLDEDERGDRGDTPPQSTGDPRSILIPLPRVMPARAFETGVDRPLRLRTYLAPGLPLELFALVRARLERDLACPVVLESETQRSAPDPDGPDPFAAREIDLAFLCAPGYLWLAARQPRAVELVPAAFVFDDPRANDAPVYFADLVVPADRPWRTLEDLAGTRWVFNDPCSLSGYFSVLATLESRALGRAHFASTRAVGSHAAALAAVESGTADCAAIDSNTLLLEERAGTHRALRVIESFGPYPTQPIVLRADLPPQVKRTITTSLLTLHQDDEGRRALAACAVRRLAPVTEAHYAAERTLLGLALGAAPCAPSDLR